MNLGTASVIRANARSLPIADNSVDLVVTSPPYFALRSYRDGGVHYGGQIGSEPTPAAFLDALLDATRECVRVLKPSGSLWVNLGDKYDSGTSAPRSNGGDRMKDGRERESWNTTSTSSERATIGRAKSLMGIPWRYALRCIDDLGLILRAEVIWSKPNGLPESVTDRVRRSHEQWFHFVLQPRYFSAVDEIREQYDAKTEARYAAGYGSKRGMAAAQLSKNTDYYVDGLTTNPLGKLPGSVWTVPTEPLRVPDHLGIDHFAAFPTEWPKRIIQGWSPAGVCVECREGRRPVAEVLSTGGAAKRAHRHLPGYSDPAGIGRRDVRYGITGYACACTPVHTEDSDGRDVLVYDWHLWSPADTTPAVVLDPFGGTGTTAMVAKALGRHGISVDMSADYCRLAEWRTNDRDQLAKVLGIAKADPVAADEQSLLDLIDGEAS